jgi:preprotein translocase subunit YajC
MYIASVASNVVGLFLVVVAVLIYFLIIRPSLKRENKRENK